MPYHHPKGSPSAQVWVLIDTPLPGDKDKGFIYSSGIGYVFDVMMRDAGFTNYYVAAYRPNTDALNGFRNIDGDLNHWQPPIIIPIGAVGQALCKELVQKRQGKDYNPDEDSEIQKYAGSILTSPFLHYPHYVVPTLDPIDVVRQWKLRDVVVSCDLMKAASELEYYNKWGHLQPLPKREYKIDFQDLDTLLRELDAIPGRCNNFLKGMPLVSNDIETIYPRDKSIWKNIHPGEILTIGLAPTKDYGISFELYRDSLSETVLLWRAYQRMLTRCAVVGQNFLNFDLNFHKMLGFELHENLIQDTMIRHHVLWPELPHRLGFLSRQYTREKFHKDDGHQWSLKDMSGLKRYNALDCMVTMEVYEEEEKEFAQKPNLL